MPSLRRTLALTLLAPLAVVLSAPPALARRQHPIRLRFPSFVVPPNSDREVCTFFRLPADAAYNAAGQAVVNVGIRRNFVSHHFLIYAYAGHSMDDFAPLVGKVVDSTACLDFGPTDRTQRVLIGGSQSPKFATRLPTGLALQIPPETDSKGKAIGFILNSHWINSDARPHRASVRIRFSPVRPHTVKRFVKPIFEVLANSVIDVPPGQRSDAPHGEWKQGGLDLSGFGGVPPPLGAACVTSVTSHMHKRGELFTVDFNDGSGAPQTVLANKDYADPIPRPFDPPLLVKPGQSLTYRCTHANGVDGRPMKLGCEEEPGVAPGVSLLQAFRAGRGVGGGAAKRCSTVGPDPQECPATDPRYPGRQFTGNCVQANLVFGFTSDDDMCILPGSYYDANAAAPAGADPCDLSLMQPVLN